MWHESEGHLAHGWAKCHALKHLHEVGGCELGMENTWPSNGHVSN